MQVYKLPNAAAHIITVSSTAGSLQSFIEAAASAGVDLTGQNGVDLIARTNGYTFLDDGNTPTATNGYQIAQGSSAQLRGVDLSNIQLIRSGGSDAIIEVRVGKTYAV